MSQTKWTTAKERQYPSSVFTSVEDLWSVFAKKVNEVWCRLVLDTIWKLANRQIDETTQMVGQQLRRRSKYPLRMVLEGLAKSPSTSLRAWILDTLYQACPTYMSNSNTAVFLIQVSNTRAKTIFKVCKRKRRRPQRRSPATWATDIEFRANRFRPPELGNLFDNTCLSSSPSGLLLNCAPSDTYPDVQETAWTTLMSFSHF